ncbi:hypothetical protein ES708_04722 [subsurface metagenome]
MGFGAIGDMTKAVYDPNKDGQIALAQLVAAVCSESEADTRVAAEATARNAAIATHAGVSDAHHTPVKMATGGYAGDESANKAIAHGLGVTPKLVIIIGVTSGDTAIAVINNQATDLISSWLQQGVDFFPVAAMNSTNFYVGSGIDYRWSMNGVGKDYKWWAGG